MLWRQKNMKTELQVSSLNQSFLPETGTAQQNSLSKHGHNCLSETLASSLLTVLLFCGILASLSHWCVCSHSTSFVGICFCVHLIVATKIWGFIWRACSRTVYFLHLYRWDFGIAVWKVLPASSSEFLSVSVVASLLIKWRKNRGNCFWVIPSQCSAQNRIKSRPVMAGVQL